MNTAKLKTAIMLAKNEPVRQLTTGELQQRCDLLAEAVVELGYTRPRLVERLAALGEGDSIVLDADADLLGELWLGMNREGLDIDIVTQPHGTCRVSCYSTEEPTPLFIKIMLVAALILGCGIYFL